MSNIEDKYEIAEAKVDSVLTELVHLKWTAVVIAAAALVNIWLIL